MLHELDHVWDYDLAGEAFEFVDGGEGFGVVVFTDFGYADAAVIGREGVFVGGENFFVEFFAWAEAAVFDLDVFVGDEAGEADHSAGEVVDLD